MISDVYEPIQFKLVSMVDAAKLNILNLVVLKVTGLWERKNVRASYFTKAVNDLNGIWYAVDTCLCVEPHTHLSHSISIQRHKLSYVTLSHTHTHKCWLSSGHLGTDFFEIWYDGSSYWILRFFKPVWMALAFIQGHSCMRSQKFLHPFPCKFLSWFSWNLVCCNNLLVCWSSS